MVLRIEHQEFFIMLNGVCELLNYTLTPVCRTNQQMHNIYCLFFIYQLLLHVSASMCHHQETCMRFLSYLSRQGVVDKILMVLISVCYVAAWRVSVCPVVLLLSNTTGQTNTDDGIWRTKHVGPIDG
jgi:hypothetical protein